MRVFRVEIRVLGGFEVLVDGRGVPARAWQQRRASELVQLLALAPRHRLHRAQVIDALWPDLPPDAGAANLRKAAHYARAVLGSKQAVVFRQGQVSLWPDAELAVDAERFETAGKVAGACELLGTSRQTLYEKIAKHGLDLENFRQPK